MRGLVDAAGKVAPEQLAALQRLCEAVGAPSDSADRIAQVLSAARGGAGTAGTAGTAESAGGAPLSPTRLGDLAWLGIEAPLLAQLDPFVDLLPLPTPVNINTATREVIVAAIDGIDLGSAQRLVQARQRAPFEKPEDIMAQLAPGIVVDPARAGVASIHFLVSGRLRLGDRVLEERSLLVRRDGRVDVLRREKHSFSAALR